MLLKQKSLKKFLTSAAVAVVVTTGVVPSASASSKYFSDVPEFYQESVNYLVESKITNGIGDGMFGTDQPIIRSHAALMIARAMGLENFRAPNSGFEDVPDYAQNAVNVLTFLGIVNGKSETSFGAMDHLTRSEMAKIIALTYEIPVMGSPHPFVDVSPVYNDYVQALYHAGITDGTGATTYGSDQLITRGQFAVFLSRAEQLEISVPEAHVHQIFGVINNNNTVTIMGKAEDIDKVTILLQNGDEEIRFEAPVVNGEFSVTTQTPNKGISTISIQDENGNILYEGIREEAEVSIASIGTFTFKDITKR